MIFYFTGTGNSLYAAKELDSEIISIPQIIKNENLEFTAERIGIVCPMYGHEMPAMVKNFIQKAVFHTDYLFVILTYGFHHANAVQLAADVLARSKKQAAYIKTLYMVDNFLPGFDMAQEMRSDKKVKEQIAAIRTALAQKKHEIEAVTDKDIKEHRRYLASVKGAPETVWADFTVTEDCIGCGICTRVCPSGSIYLENQKAIHTNINCQACYACVHACPKMAIRLYKPEKNPHVHYRNEHVTLCMLVGANDQTKKEIEKRA